MSPSQGLKQWLQYGERDGRSVRPCDEPGKVRRERDRGGANGVPLRPRPLPCLASGGEEVPVKAQRNGVGQFGHCQGTSCQIERIKNQDFGFGR